MSATSFDVHTFRRPGMPTPRTALTTVWARDLDKRESALAEREATLAKRERALDAAERIHELRQLGVHVTPIRSERVGSPRPADQTARARYSDTFKVRELEWWKKQLGGVPVLR
ncbi:MAG TPA: hypothetical protein VGC78_04325 [Gaiellaceae bacterium]|jgi:hypothetical protein